MRRFIPTSLLLVALAALSLPAPAAAQTFIPQPITTLTPDLTATLSSSASVIGGGEPVTYTLTVQNVGQVAYREPTGTPVYWNSPASGISVLQSLPPNAVFRSVSTTGSFSCAYAAPVVTCTGGSLLAGTSATITTVTAAPLGAGTYASNVTVDATNTIAERSESNNTASATIVVPQADLALSVSASETSIEDQASVTYWVYVDNSGPAADASGITLRYQLPTGASLWSWRDGTSSWLSGTQYQAGFACSTAAGVVTCTGGHIPSGGRGAITMVVTAPRMNGTMTSSFSVDPNNTIAERSESNNSASINTTVVGRVDLAVDVTHAFLPFPLTRVITVRNLGAGPASGVRVEIEATKWEYYDDGPPDTYLGTLADSGFSCTRSPYYVGSYLNYHSGDVITCTGGNIPAGGTATIRVTHWLTSVDDSRNTDATADPQNAIREPFENNNHDHASTRI